MSLSAGSRPLPQPWPLDRIRSWARPSWAVRDRTEAAARALSALAELGAAAQSRPVPPVVPVGPHGLADALVVLTADACASGADPADIGGVLTDLGAALGLTAR